MIILITLIPSLVAATSVNILEPVDGEVYDGNWLPFRVIVENENTIPDSVHYSLNGSAVSQLPRLNTDWPTYMQNYLNHGYSESPAPQNNNILWAAPIVGRIHEFPTPVVVDGLLYYSQDITGDTLFALNSATGEVEWYAAGLGYSDDAVTVKNGRVYTATDSIFCFDALNGELIWVNGVADRVGGTPIVTADNVYCCSYNGSDSSSVVCLDSDDGELIWNTNIIGRTVSCMGLSDNILVIPSLEALTALDASSGVLIWQNTDIGPGFWDSSPTIVGAHVYINKFFYDTCCFDLLTGELLWSSITGGGTATIAYHTDILYFASENGPFRSMDSASGSIVWSSPYTEHGSPGVADGLVFFGEADNSYSPDSTRIVALDIEYGNEVWTYIAERGSIMGLQGSPSIVDGVMYYPCTDGFLYAFGTGLKYTYSKEYFYSDVGWNELVVTSWNDGVVAASDTINFTVSQTGITLEPSKQFGLCATPNPIHSTTSVTFSLQDPGLVSLRIFDLSGREVAILVDDQQQVSGVHSIQWNGCGHNGQTLSSGLYLCRIEHGGVIEITGLCILR